MNIHATAARQASNSKALAQYYLSTNRVNEALKHSQDAISLTPNDFTSWALFVRCVSRFRFNSLVEPKLLANITHAFTVENIDYRLLSGPALSALSYEEQIAPLLLSDVKNNDRVTLLREHLQSGSLEAFSQNDLLSRLFRVAVVNDLRFEKCMTSLREAILWNLFDALDTPENNPDYLPLIASLASEAFLNGYVWMISEKETAAVEQLAMIVCNKVAQKEKVPPHLLGILSAYRPLYKLPCAEELQAENWPALLAGVIKTQLVEPIEEKRLRSNIPSLLPISGEVSQSVRSQYEENPYPRWTKLPIGGHHVSLEECMTELFPNLSKEERDQPSEPQILVAGCGTGLTPNILATRIRNSSITALDLSLTSIAYAWRKSKELGIKSIEYIHGDIQNVGMLGKRFDHINCFGVLHHMEDPQQGWEALNQCLKPGGTMEIGLYSEIARQSVVRVRQHIQECGYKPHKEDMRRCRQDIIERQDDPLFKVILNSITFYDMSEFRDLVFHAQEHLLTLLKIKDMLTELGLQFIGFQHQDPSTITRYRSRFPQDLQMRSLELWHQFEIENPDTFGNCYDFWVRKPA